MIETALPVLYALHAAKGEAAYYVAAISLTPQIIDLWQEAARNKKK